MGDTPKRGRDANEDAGNRRIRLTDPAELAELAAADSDSESEEERASHRPAATQAPVRFFDDDSSDDDAETPYEGPRDPQMHPKFAKNHPLHKKLGLDAEFPRLQQSRAISGGESRILFAEANTADEEVTQIAEVPPHIRSRERLAAKFAILSQSCHGNRVFAPPRDPEDDRGGGPIPRAPRRFGIT